MTLFDYLDSIDLPNSQLKSQKTVSRLFYNRNIKSFWDAIDYVKQLPFESITERGNYLSVLNENRGTCSAKHALIAALAEELNIPLKLYIGLFLLTAENISSIESTSSLELISKFGSILKSYQLEAIPESHCYLKYEDHTLDITFPDKQSFTFGVEVIKEIPITPEQIGTFKVEIHKKFICNWIKDKPHLTLDKVWEAREEWLRKLSASPG